MGWPHEAYLYLRQIVTPKSLPQNGGNFIYTKDDNELYLLDADGTEHAVGGAGGGGSLTVQDENSNVATSVTQIDFQGAGVTATSGTGEVVVTIPTPTETLPVTIIDAKGDLIAGTAADTAARVAVGSNGTSLVADSAQTPGVKWENRVKTVAAGANISIDSTDPLNPVVAASGTGTFAGAKAYRSASYSLVNNTVTAMPWDAEEFDTNGFHDTATNNTRMTIPTGYAGKYLVQANIATDASGVSYTRFLVRLTKNGTDIRGASAEIMTTGSSTVPGLGVSTIVDLAVGDYVETIYYQVSGGSRNFFNAECAMSITKIG